MWFCQVPFCWFAVSSRIVRHSGSARFSVQPIEVPLLKWTIFFIYTKPSRLSHKDCLGFSFWAAFVVIVLVCLLKLTFDKHQSIKYLTGISEVIIIGLAAPSPTFNTTHQIPTVCLTLTSEAQMLSFKPGHLGLSPVTKYLWLHLLATYCTSQPPEN